MQKRKTVALTLTNKGENYNETTKRSSVTILDRLQTNLLPSNKKITFSKEYLANTYPTSLAGKYRITDSIYLSLNEKGINGYSYSLQAYCDGILVGVMCIAPYGKGIDDRLINFRVDNSLLCTDNWWRYYNQVKQALNLRFHSFNYVEIAYDSHGPYKLIKHLSDNSSDKDLDNGNHKYEKVNKRAGVNYNEGEFTIGSVKSNSRIAIYIKWIPGKKNDKPYLIDFYYLHGLDTQQQIDRVEARLRNKFLHRYQLTDQDMGEQAVLETLFRDALGNKLSYYVLASRYSDKHGNRKYAEVTDVVDLSQLTGTAIDKRLPIQVSGDVKNIRAIKNTFKNVLNNYLKDGNKADLTYLRYYVRQKANAIVSFSDQFTTSEIRLAESSNKESYKNLIKLCIDNYKGSLSTEVINRMESVTDAILSLHR